MPGEWTFLTNQALVLLEVTRDPQCRISDLAERVGITERTVRSVLKDLIDAGYLQRTKVGRSYCYTVRRTGRFRHPRVEALNISDLLDLVPPEAAEPAI
jgi:predicted transcriptional regulator